MKKVHLIGNAHLDPVWLWRWQEGFAEIKATFKSALDRMREFEDFKFTAACGAYYMWIEKSDPAMFEEIRQRVKEGRWELTGGWLIQPDCNIPCGESFARHALITQRYFAEKFGKMAETGYNVDSFGHNGSLPMILNHSRMKNYVFMRPGIHEKTLPAELFSWESADGSRVTTHRIHRRYGIVDRTFDTFFEIAQKPGEGSEMAFYGVGNHGGGPTVELLDRMHAELDDRFVYSHVGAYFAEQSGELPVVRDDLQYHAKGCYSAFAEIKKNNRVTENKLLCAERLSVLSAHLMHTPYPAEAYGRAWQNVLFNQFHDILGGCSIREAYDDARCSHGESMAIADREQNFAIQQIGWNIHTVMGDIGDHVTAEEAERIGRPIVVFNPHAYPVTTAVRVSSQNFGKANFTYVTDVSGNAHLVQQVRASRTNHDYDRYDNLFLATVPALGYAVYRGHAAPLEGEMTQNSFTVGENFVTNGLIRMTFAPNGELCGLRDEESGRELLCAPTRLRLCNDEKHDTWAHGIESFDEELPLTVTGSFRVTERGPVRAAVRTEQSFGNSRIVRDYFLVAGARTVEVSAKVDYREKFGILKLTWPIAGEERCYAKIPFGHIERPTDGTEQVCGDWIALGGLAVANDCKYSFDAKGNALSLTVLRSALYSDHYGARDEYCEHMDLGEQRFAYSLAPFAGFAAAERQAALLQTPPFAYAETFHRGTLPTTFSGIAVAAPSVAVTAIKAHVSGKGTVVRFLELEGKDTETEVELLGTRFRLSIGHHAVKTLWLCDGNVTETDFIE